MKKIFLTGCTGFIGSHLLEKLLKKKYKCSVLVKYNSFNSLGWLDTLTNLQKNKIKIIKGDIRNPNTYKDELKQVDQVIHLASLISIPYSYLDPKLYYDVNVLGLIHLLEEVKKNKNIKRFIHTSTSEVYGSAIKIPIDENHPFQPQSPYSASKIAADNLALSYYFSYNLPITILRPFNTFGPRQSNRAIIPTIINQLSNNNKVTVGNISAKRDFTFIDDTIEAYLKAVELSEMKFKMMIGNTVNLGTGKSYSIQEIINLISKLYGHKKVFLKKDINRLRPRNSEVNHLLSNNSKAKKMLNWMPKYTSEKEFKIALSNTINWFSKNSKFYSNNNDYAI